MSDSATIIDLLSTVDSIASKLRAGKTKYPHHTIDTVSEVIKKTFQANQKPEIDKKTSRSIKNVLIEHKDEHARESLRNFQCYNDFVERLIKSHKAHCKFINTVLKTERHLIVRIDKQVLGHIEAILIIKNHLQQLNTPFPITKDKSATTSTKANNEKDLRLKEREYTCSFLAATVIFGLATIPNFHRTLLKIRLKDITVSPLSILIPHKSSEVFSRFFLPFPASAYFQRYLLFHEDLHRLNHGRAVIKPTNLVNKDSFIDINNVSEYFTKWTRDILTMHGVPNSKGLTPPQFYKAALAASLVSSDPLNPKAVSYPPFILSALSRKIKSYSYHDRYMHHLSADYHKLARQNPQTRRTPKLKYDSISVLHEAVDSISKIRMSLENRQHNLADRESMASKIMEKLNHYKEKLDDNDFVNLSLYAKWIVHMLNKATELKIGVINDYASMVPSLLYNLAGVKAFHHLSPEEREEFLRLTIREYNNRSVREHLKLFCIFVASEVGKQFQLPNWSSKELQKEDIPTPKSLISFADLDEALNRCNTLFISNTKRFKSPKILEAEIRKASNKSKIIRQVISLAFYTGLRISEIMRLRLNNIIYDKGIVLAIRVSKTRNGIRNIPLRLLMPDAALNDFMVYIDQVRDHAIYRNQPLFGKLDVKKNIDPTYSNTTIRKDVQLIFESLGYTEFVFHHLRHSFANWFLLRWFTAFHKNLILANTPFLKYELFKPKYLDRIRSLVLGANNRNRGQKAFSFAMPALARLMGHGGPIVTLETYVHNPDWLFYLYSKVNEQKTVRVTSKQATDFLQITYPTLPPVFKGSGHKTVKTDDFLNNQRNFLTFGYGYKSHPKSKTSSSGRPS